MAAIRISTSFKIILAFMLMSIVAVGVIGWQAYSVAKKEFINKASDFLIAIRENKKSEIETYFKLVYNECLSISESTMTFDAMHKFKQAFNEIKVTPEQFEEYKKSLEQFYEKEFLPHINKRMEKPLTLEDIFPKEEKTIILQALYIADNPNPIELKHEYNKAQDDSAYSRLHAKYHPIFKKMIERLGFADIYLVDIVTGDVVFNISKEIDFATNLLTGPLRKTNLASIFTSIQKTSDENFVRFIDHSFYTPGYGAPSAFIGTPIYQEGKKIGGLMFEVPIDSINDIITFHKNWSKVGLGETGEAYIVGEDKKMRTNSRFFVEDKEHYFNQLKKLQYPRNIIDQMKIYDTTILLQTVDSQAARDIFNGITSIQVIDDYFGKKALAAFTQLDITGLSWGIISKINLNEINSASQRLYTNVLLVALLVLLFVGLFAFLFARFLTRPMRHFYEVLKKHNSTKIDLVHPITSTAGTVTQEVVDEYNSLAERVFNLLKKVQDIYRSNEQLIDSCADSIKTIKSSYKKLTDTVTHAHDTLQDTKVLFDELQLAHSAQEAQVDQLESLTARAHEITVNQVDQLTVLQKNVTDAFAHYDNVQKRTGVVQRYIDSAEQSGKKLKIQINRLTDKSEPKQVHDTTSSVLHTTLEGHTADITHSVEQLRETIDEVVTFVNHMKPSIKKISSVTDDSVQDINMLKEVGESIADIMPLITKQELHTKQFAQKLQDDIKLLVDNLERVPSLNEEIKTLVAIHKELVREHKELTTIVNQIEW